MSEQTKETKISTDISVNKLLTSFKIWLLNFFLCDVKVVASEQEVNAGSADSEEHFDRTDQDLISYMLSSVLSLPQDEKDKKVKWYNNKSHWVSKSKSIYICHNLLV